MSVCDFSRIKRIENLETLTKLDVLDLHGNQVSQNISVLWILVILLDLAANNVISGVHWCRSSIPVRHSVGPLGLTLTLPLTPGMADPRMGGRYPEIHERNAADVGCGGKIAEF